MTTLLGMAFIVLILYLLKMQNHIREIDRRLSEVEQASLLAEANALARSAMPSNDEIAALALRSPVVEPVVRSSSAQGVAAIPGVQYTDTANRFDAPEPAPATRPTALSAPAHMGPTDQPAWSLGIETAIGMIKANPFASLGVLFVLVGVGFLFSLLAASNILPPWLRVMLVTLAGTALFGLGVWHQTRRPSLAINLQGGAIAVQFLCALWAYDGYALVSAMTAFVWMAILSSAAVGWSLLKRHGLFAYMGILGSLLTPIIAATGGGSFAGMGTYSAWICVMGLGAALNLGMPSMASVTIAGVSALLGAGLRIEAGPTMTTVAALLAMLAGGAGTALHWTRDRFSWAARQQASIVSLLVGTPLAMATFLTLRGGMSHKSAALVVGVVAAVYFVRIGNAPQRWKGWLLAIGCALSLVALGVGLEGPSQAMAFSVAALSVVLVARALARPWAANVAFGFWLISVGLAIRELPMLPLVVSGLVGLGASFMSRGTRLSAVYAWLAPAVLFWAIHSHSELSDNFYFAIVLIWSAVVTGVARPAKWPSLLFGALWILPAELLLTAIAPIPAAGLPIYIREILLCGGLVVSALLIQAARKGFYQGELRVGGTPAPWLAMLAPALLSHEIVILGKHFDGSNAAIGAMLAILWSGWTLAAAVSARKFRFDALPLVAGSIAAVLIVVNLVTSAPGAFTEAAQWAGIAQLWLASREARQETTVKAINVLYGIAGAGLLTSVMRIVGNTFGLHVSLAELVVTRSMQPCVSLLWAAGAIAVVFFASKTRARALWMGGGMAIVALLLKMLIVDLATFSLVAKVSVFLVMGVAFIALGAYCPLPPEKTNDAAAAGAGGD